MALDLETLRTSIEAYLDSSGLSVFHGYGNPVDALNHMLWDTERRPDFREFVECARKAGSKIISFYYRSFSLDQIDSALDQLEDTNLTREEKRNFETRLRQLQAYEGFTCSVELSFSVEAQIYSFELHTDWYEALNDILAELDAATEEEDEDDEDTLGGYFSKN
ncbi:MAG: hypothetical protein JO108_04045 [Acidobacteriaceae bacterium]|nr:hypothetical protein [Acidobacteriaceae bacterium]